MVSISPPVCDFGRPAIDFELPGVDGGRHSLASARGPQGLLVMFICNHCPYVKAVLHRMLRDTRELGTLGVGSIAIMSNDATDYPEDSWENMQRLARELAFPVPLCAGCQAGGGQGLWSGMHAGFLRLRRQTLELQYRGRLGRVAQGSRTARCPPRVVRGDAASGP
jgi:hypothetical protein